MVFGVFDGFHPGHQYLLVEAKKHCEKLIVVVAHPDIVLALKQHAPHHDLATRMAQVQAACATTCTVIAGDTAIGTWSALKKFRPDIVLLGYDQRRLGEELSALRVRCQIIEAYHPEKYKSSLLLNK